MRRRHACAIACPEPDADAGSRNEFEGYTGIGRNKDITANPLCLLP